MNKEIKKFNEFRKDEDGVFYYYDTESIQDMWSYDLDALANYIIKLQDKVKEMKVQVDLLTGKAILQKDDNWGEIKIPKVFDLKKAIEKGKDELVDEITKMIQGGNKNE